MGKGSRKRPLDVEKFDANYERVFGPPHPPKGGRTIYFRGEWFTPEELSEAERAHLRKRDSKHFRCANLGCHPKQIPEWNRRFGNTGVRFDPKTGDAYFPNRQSKLAFLKARSTPAGRMVDFDEVRG